MSPSDSASSESACSLVLDLAEEFLGRYRKGERPALREYTERHPELAAEIREVFPAMAVLEKIALHDESLEEAHDTALEGSESQSLQQLGDYRIIRVIGRGGMGVVYEAEQVSLGRHVALKVLPPQVRDAKQRQRFEREARAAAKLHHTNIVPVFGVGEQDGQPYYVMQFIQGLGLDVVLNELKRLIGDAPKSPTTTDTAPANDAAAALARSLVTDRLAPTPAQRRTSTPSAPAASGAASAATPSTAEEALGPSESSVSSAALSLLSTSAVFPGHGDKLATRKPTYWKSVAQIGIQIASALEYAHRQGVVHRDVKPSNLLLDTDGAVWVTDFGLAKAEGQQDLTHTGDMLGTLRYMPPEAFDGRSDARGDVYSLGLTLYELVALRRTFGEKDRHQLIKRITLGEPTRLDRLVPNLPRDLATIVHTAIAKEPARRYQTAGELAADLQRFVEDRPIQARHIGAIERTWRWSRRNPLVASLAAAVVLLLVAGTTVSTLLSINATLARHRADASAREAVEHAHKATQERNKALVEKDRADRAADIARANMYVVRLNSVQLALENSNAALALQLLNLTRQMRAAPSESMDWEWRYHWRSCHNALRILQGHEHEIGALAVHPAGARLVSGSADQTLREWDPATGQQLRSLSLGFATPCLALNAAGTRLAVGLGNGAVKILDATTWQEVHHFMAHPQAVRGLAFSPDDARLATGSEDRTVKLWNLADAQELRTFAGHSDHVSGVAFSPDGQWLASASEDFTVRLWNASTGQPRHTLHGPTAGLHCVAFSPDGRQLASAGRDWVIRTWDPDSGRELHALRAHTSEVRALAYSPDGRLLASAGADRSLKLWDLSSGRELSSLSGHQSALYSLVFSPDGRWIASGSLDQTIRLWRPNREVGSRVDKSHLNQARAVEFSPDGRWLASVGLDGRIIVRDVTTGQVKDLLGATSRGLLDLAFSPDSKRLAVAGDAGVVTLWDVAAGRPLFRAPAHTSWSSSLAFSPDGKTLASGGHDRIIKLLDAATGEVLKTLTGHRDEINGLAFSADGSRLFSGSIDTSIKIWDVDSGQPIRTLKAHASGVTGITLSKDNRWLASCSHDRTVKIWDAGTGQELHTLTGHNDAVWRVRFIGDGARLVSAGWDQTIRVWDTNTGLELTSLKGHSDRVLGLSVSPDGGRLASAGGRDLTVRVWDGRPLTDAIHLEAEAVDLLQYLFSRPLRKADVVAYLNRAPSLRPPLRELAVELAERFHDSADAEAFHDAAWRILEHPHANATMCRFALAQMTAACELSPDDLAYRTALAAAQYRLGRFQKEFMPKAMATLNRCDSTDPRTLALVAMTQHQLDEKEQARASLGRLRLMRADPQSVGADAAALVREAESLIEGSAGQLK